MHSACKKSCSKKGTFGAGRLLGREPLVINAGHVLLFLVIKLLLPHVAKEIIHLILVRVATIELLWLSLLGLHVRRGLLLCLIHL